MWHMTAGRRPNYLLRNSQLRSVRCCVTCYMNPTSISAHVLDKLHIPAFDPADSRHLSIAALCEEGHRASDPRCQDAVRQQLDRAVAALYGLTSADLDTVRVHAGKDLKKPTPEYCVLRGGFYLTVDSVTEGQPSGASTRSVFSQDTPRSSRPMVP